MSIERIKPFRLLLVSVSAGSGHTRAAEAVRKTAQNMYPDMIVEHVDLLTFASKPVALAITEPYNMVVREFPKLWRFVYEQANKPLFRKTVDTLTHAMKRWDSKDFFAYVNAFNPDYILCTHFLPADLLLHHAPDSLDARVGTLITDYGLHGLWLQLGPQDYFLPTSDMVETMKQRAIPTRALHATGMPVDPVFFENKSREDFAKKHSIDISKKVVLVLAGGKGLIDSVAVVQSLCTSKDAMTIISVAGSNIKLKKAVASIVSPQHIRVVSIGWTDSIDEYMRLADVIVTKPGGMTTSECLVLGKPMIIIDPIPGQEEANALYVDKHGLGIVARTFEEIPQLLHTVSQRTIHPQTKNPGKEILDSIQRLVL